MPPSPRHPRHRTRRSRNESLSGWAWLIIGAALALGVMLLVQNQFKSNSDADFFRAPPNTSNTNTVPQPAISALEESPSSPAPAPSPTASNPISIDSVNSENNVNSSATPPEEPAPADPLTEVDYDFYTILPEPDGTDIDIDAAELATPRTQSTPAAATSGQSPTPKPVRPASTPGTSSQTRPAPPPPRPTPPTAATTTRSAPPAANTPATRREQRVLLQAGAFVAPGDAEALKARVALLGLHARVESGTVDDQTVYRVRLGPYANPRELADAKQRLDDGGLSSREIREP